MDIFVLSYSSNIIFIIINCVMVRLDREGLCRIIRECVSRVLLSEVIGSDVRYLYHKSSSSNRRSILERGLVPSVGYSYSAHWNEREDLVPYVFLYDRDVLDYDSTYNDDIWCIDVSKLDMSHLSNDPDVGMEGCYVYDVVIPPSAIRLVYEGDE